MAVERRKARSAISKVFRLGFLIGDVLRQRNPFSDGEFSFLRLVVEGFVRV